MGSTDDFDEWLRAQGLQPRLRTILDSVGPNNALPNPPDLWSGMAALLNRPPAPTVGEILAGLQLPPARPANILESIGALAMPSQPTGVLAQVFEELYRPRRRWNESFAHWEKAASTTEEGTIERAEENVRYALRNNAWLKGQGVKVKRQGSYHHNTNVRREADIDLRVEHPSLYLAFAPGVTEQYARQSMGYTGTGMTYGEIFGGMRRELLLELNREFGAHNVDASGGKAIRIKGITGSRAEVDVVPCVRHEKVFWIDHLRRYHPIEGIAILSANGKWTLNYPEQHSENGIAKRMCTAHRYKKIVRVFKRLRQDMADRGLLDFKVPSFLIECLVYNVEDVHFLVEADDRYGRIRRVAHRMLEQLNNPNLVAGMMEISVFKALFSSDQAWTLDTAQRFAAAVVAHLGDA